MKSQPFSIEKAEKFTELKELRGKPEYDEWFLRYRPIDKKEQKEKEKANKTRKSKSKSKSKSKKSKGLFF